MSMRGSQMKKMIDPGMMSSIMKHLRKSIQDEYLV